MIARPKRRRLDVLDEPASAETEIPRSRPFEVTAAMREAWRASETLRTPEPGTQDVVTLKRRKR